MRTGSTPHHGTNGKVVGIDGTVLTTAIVYTDSHGNVLNDTPVHAGTYTATISFPGNNNYASPINNYASAPIVIYEADAVIDHNPERRIA